MAKRGKRKRTTRKREPRANEPKIKITGRDLTKKFKGKPPTNPQRINRTSQRKHTKKQ